MDRPVILSAFTALAVGTIEFTGFDLHRTAGWAFYLFLVPPAVVAAGISAYGLADQAHATRELRKLIGVTPAQLRAALQRDREAEDTIRIAAAFVRGRS